ncbi:MAG: TPM domain-containing protein [Mycobacterium sp.]
MSIPPYPGSNPEVDPFSGDGRPAGTRPPIKYIWPKRVAVILTGLALLGGIGFGVKTLLPKEDAVTTGQQTVASASPAPSAPEATAPTTAPMRLDGAVTDTATALSSEQTAEVTSAVKSLYKARDVRLWVVYVEAFNVAPGEWARTTGSLTKMGKRDAILAVATKQRKYAFLVSAAASNASEQAVDDLRRNTIEPKLRDGDFAGAAVAAATGIQALG